MSGAGSYLVAFGGGLVSFASPCVLPLVPVYLSMVTGLEVAEIQQGPRGHLGRITRDTAGFIAGFSTVFILLGLSATTLGRAAFANRGLLTRVSGLIVVAMALFMVGSLVVKAPWLFKEKRFHPRPSRLGPVAAPITGAAFGFGWTPCIGPILTSVLAIAATQGQAARGASLMAAYSLGLGVPFLASGLALGRLGGLFSWVKHHYRAVTLASSAALGIFGALLALDRMLWLTTQFSHALAAIGLQRLIQIG
ncbi:MAG: cytochrome c biogenesis protein CcdA [Pseudarthrobacter sp.]